MTALRGRVGPWLVPIGNMGMRGASLAARFLLAIYMARYLGFYALGLFGLMSGLAGFLPALLGFGVSYYVNREIVAADRPHAYLLLRDRLALSLAIAGAVWAAGGIVLALARPTLPAGLLLPAMIVTLEYVGFDLHLALISLRRPIAANFLLFVRSASWAVPVIGLGLAFPHFRTLDFLLKAWLAALLANFALLPLVIRDAPFAAFWRRPVGWQALGRRMRGAPLIYLNDIAANGQTYLDRFVVAHLLGVAATGVYTLCFSVTQGLYVLVATAVTQLSMPKLVAARGSGGVAGWRAVIAGEARRAFALAAAMAAAALVVALAILPRLGFDAFARSGGLFALLAGMALLKPLADLSNTGLYSLGEDRLLALVNLGGVAVSVALAILCIGLFGLIGVGISAVATQAALILVRVRLLRRYLARWGG